MEVTTRDEAIDMLKTVWEDVLGCTLLRSYPDCEGCPFGLTNGSCNLKQIFTQLDKTKVEKVMLLKYFETETRSLMSDLTYLKAIHSKYKEEYEKLKVELAQIQKNIDDIKLDQEGDVVKFQSEIDTIVSSKKMYENEYFKLAKNLKHFPAEKVWFGMGDRAVIIHNLSEDNYKNILMDGKSIWVMIDNLPVEDFSV